MKSRKCTDCGRVLQNIMEHDPHWNEYADRTFAVARAKPTPPDEEAGLREQIARLTARVAELEALPGLFRAGWSGHRSAPTPDYAAAWQEASDAAARGAQNAVVVHYGVLRREWVPTTTSTDNQ
ncbi:hypothetical protein [Streptomyces sp. NRRL F-5053]|uniref:hypothetical protein n=1 Tax=Streptomyces sp. NRRL F-5053 TaxID=1463854 RepID=UPI0013311B77|nr:hypothetical protein [Streptomyces sp. NRRL F-5053]